MTNEEAIQVFDLLKTTIRNQPDFVYQALSVAYDALKNAHKNERPNGERQTIFVVTVRDEIDGEDIVYRRFFSSEEKAETFIHDNLKGQIVMSLSEEEVE